LIRLSRARARPRSLPPRRSADLATRSCVTPMSAAAGREVVTIEGLSTDGDHPVQRAWKTVTVPQCGYCQPGQMMQAAALLRAKPDRKSTRLNSSHEWISYAVFCL